MNVYRIAKTLYINDLSGSGARTFGGRWNHKGVSMIYTSENRALATVEYIVHVPLSIVPENLGLATLHIPDAISSVDISLSDLPRDWREYPVPSRLAELGTEWAAKNESLLLRVPSAIVDREFNILINPLHPDMRYISIFQVEHYMVEKRLIR
jgi:RES domain-containing protein